MMLCLERLCIVKSFNACYMIYVAELQHGKTSKSPPKLPKELEFDFIGKSNFFRAIRADGAFGGLAPNGVLHMALYSERQSNSNKDRS